MTEIHVISCDHSLIFDQIWTLFSQIMVISPMSLTWQWYRWNKASCRPIFHLSHTKININKNIHTFILKENLPASSHISASLTQLSSACMLRHPHTDFGFPRWNNPLLSSQDQYHPNPTWQRRKLVLPWSGLNRLALLFYSTAHLNKGRGLSVPTPDWSPCHCHYHHEYLTHENASKGTAVSDSLSSSYTNAFSWA